VAVNAVTEPRHRRPTREEMEARFEAIFDIVAEIEPCGVRQVFYQGFDG
jgi:hypothetical protein